MEEDDPYDLLSEVLPVVVFHVPPDLRLPTVQPIGSAPNPPRPPCYTQTPTQVGLGVRLAVLGAIAVGYGSCAFGGTALAVVGAPIVVARRIVGKVIRKNLPS